jgi:hypothetical protein
MHVVFVTSNLDIDTLGCLDNKASEFARMFDTAQLILMDRVVASDWYDCCAVIAIHLCSPVYCGTQAYPQAPVVPVQR